MGVVRRSQRPSQFGRDHTLSQYECPCLHPLVSSSNVAGCGTRTYVRLSTTRSIANAGAVLSVDARWTLSRAGLLPHAIPRQTLETCLSPGAHSTSTCPRLTKYRCEWWALPWPVGFGLQEPTTAFWSTSAASPAAPSSSPLIERSRGGAGRKPAASCLRCVVGCEGLEDNTGKAKSLLCEPQD